LARFLVWISWKCLKVGGLGGVLFSLSVEHVSILRYEYCECARYWSCEFVGLSCGVRSVCIEFCKGVDCFIAWGFQNCWVYLLCVIERCVLQFGDTLWRERSILSQEILSLCTVKNVSNKDPEYFSDDGSSPYCIGSWINKYVFNTVVCGIPWI
jgi:hypothetical protein